jgi:hypothetical protein
LQVRARGRFLTPSNADSLSAAKRHSANVSRSCALAIQRVRAS